VRTPRRRFLKALALTPVAPAALEPQGEAPPAAVQAPAAPAGGVAEALAADELEEVRREIERNRRAAERLRASARLANADDPVTCFAARPPAARDAR
jgi:hypothetical protein